MPHATRIDRLAKAARRLRASVLDGDAVTSAAERHAAHEGSRTNSDLDRYLSLVCDHAYRVTDADVGALRDAGVSDDAIFELTVAAALGAADRRLAAGLALLGREGGP